MDLQLTQDLKQVIQDTNRQNNYCICHGCGRITNSLDLFHKPHFTGDLLSMCPHCAQILIKDKTIRCNVIVREGFLLNRSDIPTPYLEANGDVSQYSVDVIIYDEYETLGIAFYDFEDNEWEFHTEIVGDPKDLKFMWKYKPPILNKDRLLKFYK